MAPGDSHVQLASVSRSAPGAGKKDKKDNGKDQNDKDGKRHKAKKDKRDNDRDTDKSKGSKLVTLGRQGEGHPKLCCRLVPVAWRGRPAS